MNISTFVQRRTGPGILLALVAGVAVAQPAFAEVVLPDTTVCVGVDCESLSSETCTPAGYVFRLAGHQPAPSGNSGSASYVYEICNPSPGICVVGGETTTTPCISNEQCAPNTCLSAGPHAGTCRDGGGDCSANADCFDPAANYCTGKTVNGVATDCVPDSVKGLGLSHFDVQFPTLGGAGSCLGAGTLVTGSCGASSPATVGGFVIGDGSCFEAGASVAKCDDTNLPPGGCITMTLAIPGESNAPGLGATVVVDKEGPDCQASCISGPSCEPCRAGPDGSACLTRTLGFWGSHPWIANDFAPVTVCGNPLSCSGASDGKSDPACLAGTCSSLMEGLGSIGGEAPKNAAYVAMVKQLAAARLNLAATAALLDGATCATWTRDGKSIAAWLQDCEGLCGAGDEAIGASGCIEALAAFNQDQDTGFEVTPAPFDRPPVDDLGRVSGADSSQFTAAQGNSKVTPKLVIGKKIGAVDCR